MINFKTYCWSLDCSETILDVYLNKQYYTLSTFCSLGTDHIKHRLLLHILTLLHTGVDTNR